MERKTILFVDDEKKVLDGLARMLRPFRKAFDMHFVISPKEALSLMERQEVDIIVSDVRMPVMDGISLLNEVKRRYPNTMRIILTGQSSVDATLKSIGIAHQFLDKPCEPIKLKNLLQRALFIKKLMTHPTIEKLVADLDTLPSMPSIYIEIQRKLSDPNSSVEEIAKCIEKDVAMSAKILQLVNSAFFGHFSHVESPAKAVHLLGLETIKALVLSLHIFSQYEDRKGLPFSLNSLWKHSMYVGNLAKEIAIAELQDKKTSDYAFIGGMLHDIGKLILAVNMSDKYKKAIEISKREAIELFRAEARVFKTSHAEIGGYLMGLWGLPGPVVEAIVYHHHPECYPCNEFDALAAVYAANILKFHKKEDMDREAIKKRFSKDFLNRIGCEDRIDGWIKIAEEERCKYE